MNELHVFLTGCFMSVGLFMSFDNNKKEDKICPSYYIWLSLDLRACFPLADYFLQV